MTNATDRLAHMLSEMHNDNAPIGWERYRSLANLLMAKFPIAGIVKDERFFDPNYQPGRVVPSFLDGVTADPEYLADARKIIGSALEVGSDLGSEEARRFLSQFEVAIKAT